MNKMKTAREWFSELEEPYRSQAIKRIDKNNEYESLRMALLCEFTWSETPQGHEYWYNLVYRTYLE